MRIKECRICSNGDLSVILRLGKMPAVNYFPTREELSKPQPRYPLNLCFCRTCGLVQLDEVVPPEKLFRNYHYLTSASTPLIVHFRSLAVDCRARKFFTKRGKVLDIGANDGTLLLEFKKLGTKVLGVDPALNAVEAAQKIGITVLPHFFNHRMARTIRAKYGRFNIITSTNVFAHTHDIKSFLRGVKILLAPEGVLILEFAHLLDMVVKNQFDVIYHEHLSFFSLQPLLRFFNEFDMEVFDAKKVLTQGGSLRIYVRKKTSSFSPSENLQEVLEEEKENHIDEQPTLKRFASDVQQFRDDLRQLVHDIRKKKHKIVGYGAPAKGVILLNYCGFDAHEIEYLVDSTELKQGRLFPGTHIPVYSERTLESSYSDYFLLLSWNFQDAILEKIAPYRRQGAKVIIPFPKLRVI